MSEQDRSKWNQRYLEGSYHKNNPVTLLEDWLPRLPTGSALDVLLYEESVETTTDGEPVASARVVAKKP